MIEATWILIIGAVLLFLGWSKKAGGYNTLALAIGALLLIGGAFWPGYGLWSDQMSIISEDTVGGATLDITAATAVGAGGNLTATVDNVQRTITLPLDTAGSNKLTAYIGAVNFSITPIAPAGSDANSLVSIKYSVNELETFEGDAIFYLSGSQYSCDWATYPDLAVTSDSIGTVPSGTHTMGVTDSDCLQWRYRFSQGATDTLGENLRTVGESISLPITFTSGGNSYTYTVIVVCVANS